MLTCIDWFAGIGGMRLAFESAGWQCVWACELDPDARAVYAAHFGQPPDAADLRDVTAAALPMADCWVGGFPCQDLSVAGSRVGFAGDRSALVFRLLDLAAGVRPTWLVLENVPGLLSVRGGHDFGALLCALEDAGYVGAWRVLDARWFGVPQRRRRVFLVARRAGTGDVDPAEVLLESARVRRGAAAGEAAGEDFTRPLGTGSGGGRYGDLDHGALISAPVTAREQKGPDSDCNSGQLVVANTVRACDGHHGWSGGRGDGCDNLVADPISCTEGKTYSHEGRNNFRLRNVVAAPTQVRRLTPRECERLQGFPDDWTLAVPLKDSVRYRLIGNSVAVPCVAWVARRLAWMTSAA
jgi:DNA (cytosine-5)-methyltransferase 1